MPPAPALRNLQRKLSFRSLLQQSYLISMDRSEIETPAPFHQEVPEKATPLLSRRNPRPQALVALSPQEVQKRNQGDLLWTPLFTKITSDTDPGGVSFSSPFRPHQVHLHQPPWRALHLFIDRTYPSTDTTERTSSEGLHIRKNFFLGRATLFFSFFSQDLPNLLKSQALLLKLQDLE